MKKILLGLFILLSATVFGQNIHVTANTPSTIYYADQYAGKKSVIDKHASRAKRTDRNNSRVKTTEASPQLTLEF